MSTETPESLSIAHFFLDLPSASSEVRKLLDRFINDDGVVVGWGLGRSGQLGTGTRNNLITPLVVCGNDKPVRIACSSASTVWLGALGAVHTMGGNTWGELGVPDPVLFPLLTETENGDIISVSHINLRQFNWRDVIVDVRGSYAFFAALSINGEVFLWGTNRYSQCTPHPNEPICPIPHQRFIPGKKIIQVSCSNYSVLALTEDGDVYGWGHTLLLGDEKSTLKQLSGGHFTVTVGDETRSVVMDPVRVDVLCGKLIEHIRTGPWHAVAIGKDGRAYTWGVGNGGRLGHGDFLTVVSPKEVVSLKSSVIEAACGSFHTCFVTSDGFAYACGDNQAGQCGGLCDTAFSTCQKLYVPSRHKVITAACGRHHTLLLLETGELLAYGTGLGLGVGLGYGIRMVHAMPVLDNYTSFSVTSGACHNFATCIPKTLFILILGLPHRGVKMALDTISVKEGLLDAALGQGFSIMLNRRGSCYAMGLGGWGQLGIDLSGVQDFTPDRVPVVRHAMKVVSLSSNPIVKASAGICFTAVLSSSQRVYTWGSNVYGQCGLGIDPRENPCISYPQEVNWLADKMIVQVTCGCFFALALGATGIVYAWGCIECCGIGQLPLPPDIPSNVVMSDLGTESRASVLLPVAIPTLSNIIAVEAGAWHAMALNALGEVFAWGVGACGRLGNGTEEDCYTPRKVLLGAFVSRIGCGAFGSFAISYDGKLYVWGANGERELSAQGSCVLLPTHVLDDVQEAALGKHFTLVLTRSREFRFSGVMEHEGGHYVSESFSDISSLPPQLSPQRLHTEGYQGMRVFAGSEHAIAVVEKGTPSPAVVTELHRTLRDQPAEIIKRYT